MSKSKIFYVTLQDGQTKEEKIESIFRSIFDPTSNQNDPT